MVRSVSHPRELDAAVQHVEVLSGHWPKEVELPSDEDTRHFSLTSLFHGAFPGLGREALVPVAIFCRLFGASVVVHDRIVDGDEGIDFGVASMRVMAMQAEAYMTLNDVF